MTKVYFIRHGESEANLRDVVGGRALCSPLTDKGRIQVDSLCELLLTYGVKFDDIYTSPAIRAIQTADIIKEMLGYAGKVDVSGSLVELCEGEKEGRPKDTAYTDAEKDKLFLNPHFSVKGGESRYEVGDRMYKWLDQFKDKKGRIAAVTHCRALQCLMANLHGSDFIYLETFRIAPASFTSVYYHPESKLWQVDVRNHFDFSRPGGR